MNYVFALSMDDYTLVRRIDFEGLWRSCDRCHVHESPIHVVIRDYDFTLRGYYNDCSGKNCSFLCTICCDRLHPYMNTEQINIYYTSRLNGLVTAIVYGELHISYDFNCCNYKNDSPEYLTALSKILPNRKL